MMSVATISTARLRMRAPRLEDADAVFEYASDPDVTRFLTFVPHQTIADTRTFLAKIAIAGNASGPHIYWTIEELESSNPIGAINLHFRERGDEVGYAITKSCWGRGYMTEALSAVLEYALGPADCTMVAAHCDVDNSASARVMQKAGMRYAGLLQRFSVHPNVEDEPRDCYRYEYP